MTSFQHRLSLNPSMRLAFAQGILIALEGLAVFVSLLLEPSQSGGFLGFSAGRWAIIFLSLLALAFIFFSMYKVGTNQAKALETWLSKERNLFWLFFLAIILFGFSLPAGLGKIPAIRYFTYFGRIQASLIWLALASGQVGLTLLVVLRRPILRWFGQFFPFAASVRETASLTRAQRFALLGIALGYLALQLASFLQVGQASWLPDSIDYIFPAEMYGWNETGLWTHTKPWGAAVLYKLTGSSPVTINVVQTILSGLAWLSLAWVFSRVIRTGWLQMAAFTFILGFSLAPPVQMWNHIIQSESLSISLMALILAVWMSLLQRWRWEKLIALIFLFAWWTGTRETNVYLGLLVAGMLFFVGLTYKRQRFYWAVSVLLVLFGYVNLQISEIPTIPRWLYPLTNTVLNRILPDDDFLLYFEGKGLPVSARLLSLSGGFANSGDFAVFNDPGLNDAENWLLKRGKDAYIRFLIDHPVYTLTSPWRHARELLAPQDLLRYAPDQYAPILGWLFGGVFFLYSVWSVGLLAVIGFGISMLAKSWQGSSAFWLVFGLWALFFPHFYLVWHGDAFEVGRHAIQASVQLRLALWLLIVLALDKILTNDYRIRTRHRS
jgi:hypothetical protein